MFGSFRFVLFRFVWIFVCLSIYLSKWKGEERKMKKEKEKGEFTLYNRWMDVCEMRGTGLYLLSYLLTWIALDWMDGKGTVCLSVGSR